MPIPRFEVHSHDTYSNERLIDATNKTEELIDRAVEIGLAGICITNHETLSGCIRANQHGLKVQKEHPTFKVGLGNEIYLVDERKPGQPYWHFILIAKDAIGHRQLRKLSTLAWLNGYFDHMERVPTLKSELMEVINENPGHLIATSACIGGELSGSALRMEKARIAGNLEEAELYKTNIVKFIYLMQALFKDDFYIECAPGASKDQILVNKKLVEIASVFNIKMVIGTDAHYLTKADRKIHKAFLKSKDEEREVDSFYEYAYLQTEDEIIENLTPSIVDMYETMCRNSMEIYNKVETYNLYYPQQIAKVDVKFYPKKNYDTDKDMDNYPILKSLFNSDNDIKRYWVNQCWEGLEKKGIDWRTNTAYPARLEEEARVKDVIGGKLNTNMFAYPVTLQHYVDLIWESGSTVGAGRGSSCSGLNHQLLGITQLDPIKWNLPWWRYLNDERIELPDIDIDIAPSKRDTILNAIKKERGAKFYDGISELERKNLGCTLVATFHKETAKAAVLRACRGYRTEDFPDGVPLDSAQYLSSLIPSERGFLWKLKEVIYGNPEKNRKPVDAFITEMEKYPGLMEIMLGMEGLITGRGTHASGVIFFDEDPYEFGCFMRAPNGAVCTQYDLEDCETAGMTKYDLN